MSDLRENWGRNVPLSAFHTSIPTRRLSARCKSMIPFLGYVSLIVACSTPATEPARSSVPPALAPAFALLDSALSPAAQDTMRRWLPDSAVLYHMSLGMWLRNAGGLWQGGPVADSLIARGVHHPDDMSQIVLQAYGLYLNGRPVDLAALVASVPPAPTGYQELSPHPSLPAAKR